MRRESPKANAVEALAAYYSSAAEAYERQWAAALHPAAVDLLDRLPLASAQRVLDLGAGVGTDHVSDVAHCVPSCAT